MEPKALTAMPKIEQKVKTYASQEIKRNIKIKHLAFIISSFYLITFSLNPLVLKLCTFPPNGNSKT